MLINNEQANIVTKLAVTMFAAAPGGFKGYLDNLAVSKAYNMEDIAVALSSEPGFTAMYSGTTAQKVATMSKNLSLDVLDAGIRQVAEDFLTAQIDAGVNLGKLYSDALSYMLTDTNFALAASTIDKKVAVANSFTSGYGKDVYNLDILQSELANVTATTDISAYVTKYLTVAQDVIFGDASNNLFVANLSADKSTLQSGDYINGGAGVDTLTATLVDTPFAITPETSSVEILQVRSQSASGTADGDNEVLEGQNTIDAQNMRGTEQFWSVDSRADLTIEDVRHDSNLTTIGFRNADAGDVDYSVYFNSQNIKAPAGTTSGSQLFIELLDLNSMRDGTGPLTNNPYSGVKITVGGTEVVIAGPTAFTTTYADMVTALNNALDQLGYPNIRAAEGESFTAINSSNGQSYTGTKVVLTNSGAEKLEAKGWVTPDGSLPPATNIHTVISDTPASTTPALTQTNIELDNVGQASMSGDMLVGNMSTGNSGSKGIEQFNVVVDRSSWIKTLATTNNGLEVVNVQNKGANGNLRIDNNNLTDGNYGLTDVRVVDASKMTGNVTLSAVLNDDVTAKFMNLKDTAANPAADNSDIAYRNVVDTFFSYDMGAGNDNLLLDISSANLAKAGTTTREDFVLDINGNAGNDTIELRIVDEGTQTLSASTGVWYINHKANANITVNGGEGNNTIKTTGAGDVKITTGSGNDTIYTDNAGSQAAASTFNGGKATWVVNAANTLVTNLQTQNADLNLAAGVQTSTFLVNGKLTVTLAESASAGAGANVGYNVTVDIPTGANYTVTALHVNQAIKAAINNDAVLSKLMVAEDGPSQTLVIRSLIDGAFAANDLLIDLTSAAVDNAANYTASQQAQILTAYQAFAKNSAATIANAETANAASVTAIQGIKGINGSVLGQVGVAEVLEVQTIDVAGRYGDLADGDTLSLLGTNQLLAVGDTVAIASDTGLAAYIATNVAVAGWTITSSGTVVTLTQTAGNGADAPPAVLIKDAVGGGTAFAVGSTEVTKGVTAGLIDITGANSTFASDNTITAGAGNDVIVLGTGANSEETIVFSGSFGTDTVVNFLAGAAAAGVDQIDFTSYLSNMVSASGSTVSQQRIDTTLSADTAFAANEVVVTTFAALDTAAGADWAATVSFANMTDAQVLNALKGAGAGNANYSVAAPAATLVGNNIKSVMMVEDGTTGVYKVYEVVSSVSAQATDANTAFTSATLVGTIDFGSDQATFNVDNFA